MTRIAVRAGEHNYSAIAGAGLLSQIDQLLLTRSRPCALICDDNTARGFAATISKRLRQADCNATLITVPAGEQSKSLEQVGGICEQMARAGLDRSSFVIGVGGGVVGDLSGFVAAVFHRGIPHVQVPTTLLAMVDSSIGGKTAVNTGAGKNLIGAIHHPSLVIADVDTLKTLPKREFNQGFAEIIKHGIIRDAEMLDDLRDFDFAEIEQLIARNIRIKAAVVAPDERDLSGERAVLNFGHTVGHAIERAAGYGELLHGEAISLGIIAACTVSMKRAGLDEGARDKVVALLKAFDLPTQLPSQIAREKIMEAIAFDKKFERGQVRFVVTPRFGEAYLSTDATFDDIREAVQAL